MAQVPGTIAASLVAMSQSKFMYDMVETETLSTVQLQKKLYGMRKTFGCGWFTGCDGNTHLGVEEEELLSNYQFGVGFGGGREPWSYDWSVY